MRAWLGPDPRVMFSHTDELLATRCRAWDAVSMTATKRAPSRRAKKARQAPAGGHYTFDLRTKRGTLDVYNFMYMEMQGKGWTVPELAGRADIGAGTLHRWFSDDPPVSRGPFARGLISIFNALGYDVATKRSAR